MLDREVEKSPPLVFRAPRRGDARKAHLLVNECKALDLNSLYSYLLLCSHFSQTCAVAERGGELVGFLSGYLKPSDPETLFIWQVAVSPRARGLGVGRGLLDEVAARPECQQIRRLEATISPSNEASWALFESFARERKAPTAREPLFRAEDFGAEEHEEETLLRVGPF